MECDLRAGVTAIAVYTIATQTNSHMVIGKNKTLVSCTFECGYSVMTLKFLQMLSFVYRHVLVVLRSLTTIPFF